VSVERMSGPRGELKGGAAYVQGSVESVLMNVLKLTTYTMAFEPGAAGIE